MISIIGRPYCQKVLPLVYDESLSYYEILCKLRLKINECIEEINSYSEVIEELKILVGDLTKIESDIAELQEKTSNYDNTFANLEAQDKQLQRQIEELTELVNGVVIGYSNLQNYIDNKYNELAQRIANQNLSLSSELHILINNLQLQIDVLAKEIDSIDTDLYNPWARVLQKESIQKNFNYAYSDLADLVPLASEYSELGLTADEYSAKDITAYEYSVRGRIRLKLHYVFSPVYGFKQEINNVLTSVINFLCNTLSSNEYSALDITAEEYSNLNLSASDYYRFNPSMSRGFVQVSELGSGLTRAEYEKLEVVSE